MRKFLIVFLVTIGWAFFFIRLYVRLSTPNVPITESLIQYFSYFSILTKLIVSIYCTYLLFQKEDSESINIYAHE